MVSTGGKYIYEDDQETPNLQHAMFDFGAHQIAFEVRNLLTCPEGGMPLRGFNQVANMFFGSDGYMTIDPNGFQVYKGEKHEVAMDEKAVEKIWDPGPHFANFLDAVRKRDHKVLNADIESGAAAAALCHLANISYRRGQRLQMDPARGRFTNDEAANRMLTRNYRAPYVVPEKV